MNLTGLGVDVLDIKRFNSFGKSRNNQFLLNNFSKKELDYCFSFKSFGEHLAGTFAAKEAVFKALGKDDMIFSVIEIRREKNGKPNVYIKGKLQKSILVSISHSESITIAIAIKQ